MPRWRNGRRDGFKTHFSRESESSSLSRGTVLLVILTISVTKQEKLHSAYIIGVALGDGNLSCPNGRATRLRITCDTRYPKIAEEITHALQSLFPDNKVAFVPRETSYFDISVYSNKLDALLPWKVGCGSKSMQVAHVPVWIMQNPSYIKACLRGLLQTDGSIYHDRGYLMVNFTNIILPLVEDVVVMIQTLGFNPRFSKTMQKSGKLKYTVRLARNTGAFLKRIALEKA